MKTTRVGVSLVLLSSAAAAADFLSEAEYKQRQAEYSKAVDSLGVFYEGFVDYSVQSGDDGCDSMDTSTEKYASLCTADGFQGPSVCGEDANGAAVIPDGYLRDECSKSPSHELDGQDDDQCQCTPESATKFFEWLQNPGCSLTSSTSEPDACNENSYTDWSFLSSMYQFPKAWVVNGKDVTTEASIIVNAGTCVVVLYQPVFGGMLDFTSGTGYVIQPDVRETGTVKVTGGGDAYVLGGSNKGAITVTDHTGKLVVADVVNSGPVTVTNVKDVFIAGTTNSGAITATRATKLVIIDTTNDADIVFDGGDVFARNVTNNGKILIKSGNVDMDIVGGTGTIEFEVEASGSATGTINAPAGSVTGAPEAITVESPPTPATQEDSAFSSAPPKASVQHFLVSAFLCGLVVAFA